MTLQAAHIRGEHNVLADIMSRRRTVLKTEWRLGTATFEWVSSRSSWGPPTINLFANNFNTLPEAKDKTVRRSTPLAYPGKGRHSEEAAC